MNNGHFHVRILFRLNAKFMQLYELKLHFVLQTFRTPDSCIILKTNGEIDGEFLLRHFAKCCIKYLL